MTFIARVLAPAVALLLISPGTYAFDGPLQTTNQFPLFLHAGAPSLESAAPESSISAVFSYSSVYVVENSGRWSVAMDMEIAELALLFRRKLMDSVEVSICLPLLSLNSGITDGFLEAYHDAFGFPDYGRSDRPENDFIYEVGRGGSPVVRGKSGSTGIGDVRIGIKKSLIQGDPHVSIRADVELPTGNADRGLGNGSADFGFGILLDKDLGDNFRTYLNAGAVLPGDINAEETIDLNEYFYGGIGVESSLWEPVNILAQVFVQTSPFPDTGISEVDGTAVMLTFGGRYSSGQHSFELSFSEDLNTTGAPDFTTGLSYRRSF